MTQPLNTVVINGSLHRPSRTGVLLDEIEKQVSKQVRLETEFIDLVDLVPYIGTALCTDHLNDYAKQALTRIEQADFLIVGTPVFKGSIPGLCKHLFDLVDMNAIAGKPVLLAATGGSTRHALMIDHQLRTLFGFFHALSLPAGVYATQEDIQDGLISSTALKQRLDLVANLATPVLQGIALQKQHNAEELIPA